jgi:hypothetical protein
LAKNQWPEKVVEAATKNVFLRRLGECAKAVQYPVMASMRVEMPRFLVGWTIRQELLTNPVSQI